jgi:glycosidase
LHLSKPEVLGAMLEELGFWLRQDIDGVRLDSIQCITTDPDLRPNPRASTKGPNIRMSGGPARSNVRRRISDRSSISRAASSPGANRSVR